MNLVAGCGMWWGREEEERVRAEEEERQAAEEERLRLEEEERMAVRVHGLRFTG